MNEHKIKKTKNGWEVDYSEAPVIIRDQPTKKNPNIKVDMGLKLVPVRINYDGDFSEDQVKQGIDTLDKMGCKLCESSEKTVAKFFTMMLDKEGIQPVKQQPETDIETESILGFRERIRNRNPILNREGVINDFLNNKQNNTTKNNRPMARNVFSIQEFRKYRPRLLEMFRMEI
jgi:hypothetical protein